MAKSFDTIATRDLWSAIALRDLDAVKRALRRGANINESKRPNAWSGAFTPFLSACRFGCPDIVKYLHKAGARRRSSGNKSCSGLGIAVHHQQSQVVAAILEVMKPSQIEMFEAYRAIDEGPRMDPDKSDRWVDFLTTSFEEKGVKLDDKTAASILMLWLGGHNELSVEPARAMRLLASPLMPKLPLSKFDASNDFATWGWGIANRNWGEDGETLELLHQIGFPFDVFKRELDEGHQIMPLSEEKKEWVAIQATVSAQRALKEKTPEVGASRPGMRL